MKTSDKQPVLLKQNIQQFKDVLTKRITDCNQVFLTAHKIPDFDAIASLGAMGLICKRNKKAPYIVIDDNYDELSDKIKEMIEKIKEKFVVITLDDYEKNITNNDLLITVDVNKKHMTCFDNKYLQFKNIVIVDHHNEDDKTIKTQDRFILEDISSCSEILYYLLKSYNITSSDLTYYSYLLAGIYLDTNKCNKNMQPSTYDAIKGLISKGADQVKVDELFSLDFDSDRRVHLLVNDTTFMNIRAAIAVDGSNTYLKEEVAKAADHMLNYDCDIAIASGKGKDGLYFVSARSKNGIVGIDDIMYRLNQGGGNLSSASCEPIFVDADSELEKEEIIKKKIINILTFKDK